MIKRMKGSRKHVKGRVVNIIIISCQIISPIITNLVSMVSIAQNGTMIDIIKSYVAMAFIIQIDNIFVTLFPDEIIENTKALNKSGLLKMTVDNNTTSRVVKRFLRKKNIGDVKMLINTILDLAVNLWYATLLNTKIVFFNYLAPLLMVGVQIWGIYH